MFVIEDLLRCVDADPGREGSGLAARLGGADIHHVAAGEFGFEEWLESEDVVGFFAGEAEGFDGLA